MISKLDREADFVLCQWLMLLMASGQRSTSKDFYLWSHCVMDPHRNTRLFPEICCLVHHFPVLESIFYKMLATDFTPDIHPLYTASVKLGFLIYLFVYYFCLIIVVTFTYKFLSEILFIFTILAHEIHTAIIRHWFNADSLTCLIENCKTLLIVFRWKEYHYLFVTISTMGHVNLFCFVMLKVSSHAYNCRLLS